MSEPSTDLLKLANAAGYFFQERLREEILNSRGQQHNWWVETGEHRWVDKDTGQEGFIDLVLSSEDLRLVVECKRTRGADWVFLVSKATEQHQRRAKGLYTIRNENKPPQASWVEFYVKPACPEAGFCVVRGQGDRDQPILERLGGLILRSTESLAEEELNIGEISPIWGGTRRLYFPVIVTNARLHACFYHPSDVDISTGDLSNGEFKDVGAIRFRKSLSTGLISDKRPESLAKANKQHERTIFVVSADALDKFLQEFDIVGGGP